MDFVAGLVYIGVVLFQAETTNGEAAAFPHVDVFTDSVHYRYEPQATSEYPLDEGDDFFFTTEIPELPLKQKRRVASRSAEVSYETDLGQAHSGNIQELARMQHGNSHMKKFVREPYSKLLPSGLKASGDRIDIAALDKALAEIFGDTPDYEESFEEHFSTVSRQRFIRSLHENAEALGAHAASAIVAAAVTEAGRQPNLNSPLVEQLPPPHDRRVLGSDRTPVNELLLARVEGPYCGELESPLFRGQLNAVNESTYILSNLYINSALKYDYLSMVFDGPELSIPRHFTVSETDRLSLESKWYLFNTKRILADIQTVTISDNLKQFVATLNISQCFQPSPIVASPLANTDGVSSGTLVLFTANFLVVRNFTFPDSCPAAHFWAGVGSNPEQGFLIRTPDDGVRPLHTYQSEDVYMVLPQPLTFYDIDYFGVYCPEFRKMLGQHTFVEPFTNRAILPPSFSTGDRFINEWAPSFV